MSRLANHMVPFGLRDGKLYAPAEVESGLACECVCPGCGAALVAKKGNEKRWHFSHLNVRPGESCAESAIHAAAKQVLIEYGELMVPEFAIDVAGRTKDGRELYEHEILSPMRRIRFDCALPEVTLGDIRPDVVGYRGERQLLVEMYFRHRVDQVKREKLTRLGLPALEIDLSDLDPGTGFEPLIKRVISGFADKEWLVYPGAAEHRTYLQEKLVARVDAANQFYSSERQREARARAEEAARRRVQRQKDNLLEQAFAGCSSAEQHAILRKKLGIEGPIPAFLCRSFVHSRLSGVPTFVWQASIFEKFVLDKGQEGQTFTANTVGKFLSQRFKLPWPGPMAEPFRSARNYLKYLADAGFLREDGWRSAETFHVRHDQLSMPGWCSPETRFDGEPALTECARGMGELRSWKADWPRWRAIMDEAAELLSQSPHQAALLDALQGLSPITPPPTPHHWAMPLTQSGVPLLDIFALLDALGLIAAPGR